MKPEVSALDYTNAVTVDGFLIPAISSRVAETEVVLKDGESFAIAGLIDNRVTQVLNKIWGLGDIPILGNLFRSRSTQKTTDELMVVVTPRFVKPIAPGQEVKLPQIVMPYLPPAAPEKKGKGKGQIARLPRPMGRNRRLSDRKDMLFRSSRGTGNWGSGAGDRGSGRSNPPVDSDFFVLEREARARSAATVSRAV